MATDVYALLGDMVGSRKFPDRRAAQETLGRALSTVNQVLEPAQGLEPTVGDEFQGVFETLPGAVLAGLLVRLALLPEMDVRCGVGAGELTVHDDSRRPLLQDGPAWWAAREALQVLSAPRRSAQRTWYLGSGAASVNSFVICRDRLVSRLNDRGCRMLRMTLMGATQQRIAEVEGISKSAVSQQFSRGIGAIRDAQATFEGKD